MPWTYHHVPAPPEGHYEVPFQPYKGARQVHTIVVSAKGRIRLPDHPGIGPKMLLALSRNRAATGILCRCCEVLRYILERTSLSADTWGKLAPRQRRHGERIKLESDGISSEIYQVFRVTMRRRSSHEHPVVDPLVLHNTQERLLQWAVKAHMRAEQANNELKARRIASIKKHIKVK